jgi:hypothetical protein
MRRRGFAVLLAGSLAIASAALADDRPTRTPTDRQVAAAEREPVSLNRETDRAPRAQQPSARERRLSRDPWRSGFDVDPRQGLLTPLSPGVP